jgi:hypothetical protein
LWRFILLRAAIVSTVDKILYRELEPSLKPSSPARMLWKRPIGQAFAYTRAKTTDAIVALLPHMHDMNVEELNHASHFPLEATAHLYFICFPLLHRLHAAYPRLHCADHHEPAEFA